jgi:RNA polymerase sigma-70 factor, ECF subfamily
VATHLISNFHGRATAIVVRDVPQEKDDRTLVSAAAAGQAQEFGVLVQRNWQKILRVAWRITGNQEDAKDIAQETFVKAHRFLDRFEGKSSFSTWVTRIAINEALMWLRKQRWLRHASAAVSNQDKKNEFSWEMVRDEGADPETSYSQQERALLLNDAMKQLRPGVRRAMELRELTGLSTEETARALGISVGAVKSRLFHGRRKLHSVLKRHVESPGVRELSRGRSRRPIRSCTEVRG